MASNTTTATEVNFDDWSFRNWPAVVFYMVQNILWFVSAVVGMIAILIGIVALVTYAIRFIRAMVLRYQRSQQKPKGPPARSQDPGREQLLQERDVGDDEAAEQLLKFENGTNVLESDREDSPPTYDDRLSFQACDIYAYCFEQQYRRIEYRV